MIDQLKYEICQEYNGTWCMVTRGNFDLFMREEPYQSLVMLINLDTMEFIVRVLGMTRLRGLYANGEELERILNSTFSNTVTCVGNPELNRDGSVVEVVHPFPMLKSASCSGYYTPSLGEKVFHGQGRCSACRSGVVSESTTKDYPADLFSFRESSDLFSELCSLSESTENTRDSSQKRKRGRPRRFHHPPKKRQLSEITRKKISDNNKRFSICKLCKKQCRGFRGLVDHMHRDHEDYKPWVCHLCGVRTAFVKTLYRHLKQEHETSGCPCHVCGKTFTRAQSMLLHVNTKHQDTEPNSEQLHHDLTNATTAVSDPAVEYYENTEPTSLELTSVLSQNIYIPLEDDRNYSHYGVTGSVIRYCKGSLV